MIPEKLYQKSRLLFNSSKKNLGKEHKGEKKKTQTLRPRRREQRRSLLRQKQRTQRRVQCPRE